MAYNNAMEDAVTQKSNPLPGLLPYSAAHDARYHIIILVLATAVFSLSALLNEQNERVFLPFFNVPLPGVCSFQTLTGIDCPGCGLTRSFISLVRADFYRAWQFNPAGFLVFAVIAFQVPYRSWQLWRLWKCLPPRPWLRGMHFLWVVVVGLFAQWIYRLINGGF